MVDIVALIRLFSLIPIRFLDPTLVSILKGEIIPVISKIDNIMLAASEGEDSIILEISEFAF